MYTEQTHAQHFHQQQLQTQAPTQAQAHQVTPAGGSSI